MLTVNATIEEILSGKSSKLWSVSPDTTVHDAIQIMADRNIGAVLVMDGDRLVGVMSERDYARKVTLKGRSSKETRVREIISQATLSVTREHSVEDCMKLMTTYRVRHLPVLAGVRVIGLVSIGDLVNWIISAQSETIFQLENYIAGQYPG